MEHKNHDQEFVINFGKVMAGLGAIFAICIIAASLLGGADVRDDAAALAQVDARTAPPGMVVTDPAMLVKVSNTAKREPLSGDQVVAQVCAACHQAGVLQAPKIGDKADWQARLGQGYDTLVKHSVEGIRQMPAKGGDPDLTEDEIGAAVKVMIEKSGITL
ncbi:c-type cytochrome [Flagellatimonas centrodinii]|uniref:c-type cytochrome n=1 Tax=Flagellatimonas centrodinii TaxID=2806210 RepID=UPI001FF056C8|nr:c-type cytochrome [Flagellatimonas centrodinii]ULQ45110.1 c-type cytochrome [Flagellatimonas centrodinii]